MLTVLIMAGGSGERFWPISTPEHPKQVLSIFTGKPMIRETVDRVLPLVPIERIFVATNIIQKKAILEALPELPLENLIIEPAYKDTAAAIGFGTLNIQNKFKDAVVAVLASDHIIKNNMLFLANLENAYRIASGSNAIVTLGIKPSWPETGYGYIQVTTPKLNEATDVISFKEKPNYDKAVEYLESGQYLWNSGMFVFSIKTIMNAFKLHATSHFEILSEIKSRLDAGLEISKETFERFNKVSIDYAIMEKYSNIKLIATDFGWSDVGDFNALEAFFDKDKNGNIDLNVDSIFIDSDKNIVICKTMKKHRISLLGIKNSVIIVTDENTLIVDRNSTQKIKEVLKKIKE